MSRKNISEKDITLLKIISSEFNFKDDRDFIDITLLLKQLENNHYNLINSLFTKKSLDTFYDTTYFKASIYQLTNIIAPLETTPNKNTIKRLNNLITTTNFSMFCHNYDLMFELFSDE